MVRSDSNSSVMVGEARSTCIILKVILCRNYVDSVGKSSIKLSVGRTLSRVGKSGL